MAECDHNRCGCDQVDAMLSRNSAVEVGWTMDEGFPASSGSGMIAGLNCSRSTKYGPNTLKDHLFEIKTSKFHSIDCLASLNRWRVRARDQTRS